MSTETAHMLTTLKTAMRVLGYTNRDVERKLGISSSYLSRLFSGSIELRFQHIVDIARAIGMEPEEILYLAYPHPKQPPTEAAARIRTLVGAPAAAVIAPPAAPPAPSGPTQKDIEEMMTKTIQKLFGELAKPGRLDP
jgi:transcriptional regulator with XRE-family HTH domain